MIEAKAFAKVTLSLRVSPPVPSGLHPVDGRLQSIDWHDTLRVAVADEDTVATGDGGEVVDGERNLAWRAALEVRSRAVSRPPLALTLDKALPVASGVGGGSADAAAALGATAALLGVDRADIEPLAPGLGSDVPFCLVGGAARIGGLGDIVDPLPRATGYTLGLVVPPFEVATPAVYRRWDELDGPEGAPLPATALPPSLREEPLANDLYPAAVSVAPEIDEWRAELEHRWGRPVALAGSGPTLYAFFLDRTEAEDAIASAPIGSRGTAAADPVDYGWLIRGEGSSRVTDSKGRVLTGAEW